MYQVPHLKAQENDPAAKLWGPKGFINAQVPYTEVSKVEREKQQMTEGRTTTRINGTTNKLSM